MKKIMIVNTYYYPDIIGGAEVSVKKLAEALSGKGYEVVILCTGRENVEEHQGKIKVIRRHFKNILPFIEYKKSSKCKKVIYKAIDYYNILNGKEIQKIVEEEKPDIIHTNNLFGISPVVWSKAKKINVPVIHTLRDYFLMCPKTNLMRKDGFECQECHFLCRIYRNIYKRCSKNVDFVTAPSLCTLNKFLENGYFEERKSRVVYNAIDFDRVDVQKIYEHRKENILEKNTINLIYVGGLYKHKGIEWLLKSFSMIENQNIILNIAGKGELKEYVENKAKKDNRIKYHGFLDEESLHELLLKNDVLVIPSLWEEPFGRVILDAYKSCIPVIGSNIGGIPELIDNGKTGFLIEPGNVQELTEQINILTTDNKLLLEMYDYIIKALEKFSIDAQILEFEKCYEEIS